MRKKYFVYFFFGQEYLKVFALTLFTDEAGLVGTKFGMCMYTSYTHGKTLGMT